MCRACDETVARQERQYEQELEYEAELLRRMTAAMREADRTFQKVGGGMRHHVRDCLLPILEKHGLVLSLADQCQDCGTFDFSGGRSEQPDGCTCLPCAQVRALKGITALAAEQDGR